MTEENEDEKVWRDRCDKLELNLPWRFTKMGTIYDSRGQQVCGGLFWEIAEKIVETMNGVSSMDVVIILENCPENIENRYKLPEGRAKRFIPSPGSYVIYQHIKGFVRKVVHVFDDSVEGHPYGVVLIYIERTGEILAK